MSVSFEIDVPDRLVRVRVTGPVSDTDLLDADDELRADPRFEAGFDELIDTSDAVEESLSVDALRELARRPPLFSPESRRAVVVRTDRGYGLARIFQLRRGDVAGEIQIFRSLAHAEHWLGRGPSPG